MIAYKEIEKELRDVIGCIHSEEYAKAEERLTAIVEGLEKRFKSTNEKVLDRRRGSVRAEKLHNVNNRLSYARKKNNLDLIKRLEEEKEYIKNNIFD